MRHLGLFLLLFTLCRSAVALETDQYTPPPRPLTDLGTAFDREVESILRNVADQANLKRDQHLRRTPRWPRFWRQHHVAGADRFLADAYITRAAFLALSRSGTPQNRMEAFFRYGDFEQDTSIFRVRAGDSIYGSFKRPITLQALSPTINLYGVYCGTDKLGHFFEQGYEYHEAYAAELARTGNSAAALRKAIQRGVKQEKTYYGLLVDGVYSNADLAANYSGLLFYLNLTQPIILDGMRHKPLFVLRDGRWTFNRDEKRPLTLHPFVTDHFNEALNPSRFNRVLGEVVTERFRPISHQWLAFYRLTPAQYQRKVRELRTFFGSSYGHAAPLKPSL